MEQFILSTQCQGVVLRMGHEILPHVLLSSKTWGQRRQGRGSSGGSTGQLYSEMSNNLQELHQMPEVWESQDTEGTSHSSHSDLGAVYEDGNGHCWTSSQEQCRPQVHFDSV